MGYLSPTSVLSLKKTALPSRPCCITSALVGKVYEAVGQAYQAGLLKDLDFY